MFLNGNFKQKFFFTISSYKIFQCTENWILLYCQQDIKLQLLLARRTSMYTVFGCFMDIFFHSCCGFPIHSSHSLNSSVREETMVYHERCNQQQISEPRLYTGQRSIWRIPSMMHRYWEKKCYIMLASKCYLCRQENWGFQSGTSFPETRIYWWFLEAEPASFGRTHVFQLKNLYPFFFFNAISL